MFDQLNDSKTHQTCIYQCRTTIQCVNVCADICFNFLLWQLFHYISKSKSFSHSFTWCLPHISLYLSPSFLLFFRETAGALQAAVVAGVGVKQKMSIVFSHVTGFCHIHSCACLRTFSLPQAVYLAARNGNKQISCETLNKYHFFFYRCPTTVCGLQMQNLTIKQMHNLFCNNSCFKSYKYWK